MLRCPVPGCDHVGEIYTHYHAKTHGFTDKGKLFAKHGEPIDIQLDAQRMKKNLKLYTFPTAINRQYCADTVSRAERKARRDKREVI